MIQHYFKIVWRNLLKYKTYTMINIAGLVAGLTASLLIYLWIADEYYVDRFHVQEKNLYQVMINDYYPDGKMDTYKSPTVMIGDVLRKEIPGIKQVTQSNWPQEMLLKVDNQSLTSLGLYVDSSFFDVFTFPLQDGNPSQALPSLNSIAISQSLAKNLFGSQEPIGETIEVNKKYSLIVSSVFKDIPRNSSLTFDFVIPFELWKRENTWAHHWRSGATQAFVILSSHASFMAVDKKIRTIIKSKCNDCHREAFLALFSDQYLHGQYENGKMVGGRIDQLKLFAYIAIIILIMACINFINLTTARSITRYKEIGVRKASGATKSSLQWQFLGESFLITCLAMIISIMATGMILPWLNLITHKSILLTFDHPHIVIGITGITLLTALVAGYLPSFHLASLKAISVLKSNLAPGGSNAMLRKILVVIQFTASIVLLIASSFVYKQLIYIQQKDLGFQRKNRILVDHFDELNKNLNAFNQDILQIPGVQNIGFLGSNVFELPITTTDPVWPSRPANSSLVFKVLRCDEGFIPALHVPLQAGRNFNDHGDSSNYIINEKTMLSMGLTKENVIGTSLEMWNGKGQIIGLTNDFLNGNMYESTKPLIMMFSKSNGFYHILEMAPNTNANQILKSVQSVMHQYAPDHPFSYHFMDEVFSEEYRNEYAQGKIILGFTFLSFIICCLGLLGLSAFLVERKTKEIGVRKILGAGTLDIFSIISRGFIELIILSLTISIPLSYYWVNKWMAKFAFHATITSDIFLVCGVLTISICLITIGAQSVKAILANPVHSLRNE